MKQPQFLSQPGMKTTLVLLSLVSHDHETPQPVERCLPSHSASRQVQQQPPRSIRSQAFWGERNDPTTSIDEGGSTVRTAPGMPRWRKSLILWRCHPPPWRPPSPSRPHACSWLARRRTRSHPTLPKPFSTQKQPTPKALSPEPPECLPQAPPSPGPHGETLRGPPEMEAAGGHPLGCSVPWAASFSSSSSCQPCSQPCIPPPHCSQ